MINEDKIIELTSIGGNIDFDKIRPFLTIALRSEIKPILGLELYNKILNDFESDTLSGVYQLIHSEYVEPMTAYFTVSHFLTMHPYSISNGGIFRNAPEDTENPEIDEIKFLAERYTSLGWGIEKEFNQFIKDNKIKEVKGSGCNKRKDTLRLNWKIQ